MKSETELLERRGRQREDGYIPVRYRCARCGRLLYGCAYGNGPGYRDGLRDAERALSNHQCPQRITTITEDDRA